MYVYVAGRVKDLDTVRQVQSMVRHCGHTITFDWTPMVEKWGGKPDTTPKEVRQEAAISDRQGVMDANLLIAIGHSELTGTLWECGMAAATIIPIWLVWWERCDRRSVFEDLPNVSEKTIQEVGDGLWTAAQRQGRNPYVLPETT